ncbi:hypothetical protein HJC23_006786 [Cyclotella cryptica]|uniref:Uncharacterized protein n=1 Tax=Cyclotella cryptica TaxID=29204 RepID=A0ABD3PFL3_9STRA|eukprot:CCRYP_015118-RA/>CCRYP_015118-RA protein AED:0.37 eAED:0.37 QI:0/-1/0/1/-1/1/1/0/341
MKKRLAFIPPSQFEGSDVAKASCSFLHCALDSDFQPNRPLSPIAPFPSRQLTSRRSFVSFVAAVASSPAFSYLCTTPTSGPSLNHLSFLKGPSSVNVANAAETIGKDPDCNDASCLGVWDGLLADCPHDSNKSNLLLGRGAGCVSSQDDTPGIFAEPWDYSDSVPLASDDTYERQMDLLILALQTTSKEHGDVVKIDLQSGRYLRAIFTDGTSGETSVSEFYFTPDDTTVQFRLGSVTSSNALGLGRSLSNMERSERIRKALRYLKVPVLRNRKRTFFFVESDGLDEFGPGSAALGPPEEMSPGDLQPSGKSIGRTRRLSEEVDPRLRIDWVESFPFNDRR